MRKGFKTYNKRKPFKRKKGGARFMLGSTGSKEAKFEFPMHLRSGASEALTNLISLILGQKRKQSGIKTGNR